MHHLDLSTIVLLRGSHDNRNQGVCLLEKRERNPDGTFAGTPIARRFASKLRPDGDCLVFTGSRNEDGYGSISVGGRMVKTHRLAWELIIGPIPDGMVVCHRCDNPPCCYVDHLFLGTVADNNADRHIKGRTVMPTNGPDFWRAKTHCPQGHEYSGDNVRYRKDGRRRCAACYREATRRRRAAKKGE